MHQVRPVPVDHFSRGARARPALHTTLHLPYGPFLPKRHDRITLDETPRGDSPAYPRRPLRKEAGRTAGRQGMCSEPRLLSPVRHFPSSPRRGSATTRPGRTWQCKPVASESACRHSWEKNGMAISRSQKPERCISCSRANMN